MNELTYEDDRPDPLDALLSSDLAQAVVNDYTGVASHGDPAAAAAEVFGRYGDLLRDPVEGPTVLLALAATMAQRREVLPAVREAALELIDDEDTARGRPGEDRTLSAQRREVLDELRRRLGPATEGAGDEEDDADDEETFLDDDEAVFEDDENGDGGDDGVGE